MWKISMSDENVPYLVLKGGYNDEPNCQSN